MNRITIEYSIEQKKKEKQDLVNLKEELKNSVSQFFEKCDSVISNITEINSILDYSKDTMISPDIKDKNANMVSKISNSKNNINAKETDIMLKIDNKITSLQNEIDSLNNQLSKIEE